MSQVPQLQPEPECEPYHESPEHEWGVAAGRVLTALAVGALGGGVTLLVLSSAQAHADPSFGPAGVGLVAAGALLSVLASAARPVARGVYMQRLREHDARVEAEKASEDVASAGDLVGLIRANARQMKAYDVLARGQARSSYRMAQIAMTLGMLVLVGGAVASIAVPDMTARITVATLSGLGGALSTFISRTFLRTYRMALTQLNYYFEQPLVTSYILASERVVESVSETRRDDLFSSIVTQILSALVRSREAAAVPTQPFPPMTAATSNGSAPAAAPAAAGN
jgi:hypothetical protein